MAEIDIRQIMEILPHRYPFLLIDRILELEPGVRARGYKNITFNEPQFTGHFPGNPLFPGVYMIEAMAQLGGAVVLEPGEFSRKIPYLAGIDKAKFRRPVVPGDRLDMEVTLVRPGIYLTPAGKVHLDQTQLTNDLGKARIAIASTLTAGFPSGGSVHGMRV